MYFVYILQSQKDNGYYVGYTSDMEKRLKEHNSGRTRSQRNRLPLDLVYLEEFGSKRDAKARENQIKSWKGGEAFKRLIGGSPRFQRDSLAYCGIQSRHRREIPGTRQRRVLLRAGRRGKGGLII